MTTEQIIKQLDIEQSDEHFKAHMISTVMATADLRFARIVDDIMTVEERKEFEEFASGKEPQEIANWVNEKFTGIGDMYTAILTSIVMDLKNKTATPS